MKIQLTLTILLILGTLICWYCVFKYKMKLKILKIILAIPFGWLGLIYGFVKIIDIMYLIYLKKIKNDN